MIKLLSSIFGGSDTLAHPTTEPVSTSIPSDEKGIGGVVTMTVEETIEEIHKAFYGSAEQILKDCSQMNSLETDKQDLIDKCKRLKSLGFTATREVVAAERELSRLKELENRNKENTELIDAVNYFSQKYPQYKFITEDSVKDICRKYGLVYSEIARYKGTVPDKNLEQIEKFKIKDKDKCHAIVRHSMLGFGSHNTYTYHDGSATTPKGDPYVRYFNRQCPLEIAGPLNDFDLDRSEVKDFQIVDKIEIPDPVVLQPVFYAGKKHYLIITAWGLEGSDPLVVNQKMN